MPVSGLVVTLKPDRPTDGGGKIPASNSSVMVADSPVAVSLQQIQQHPNFEVGDRQGLRLPVVLDTPDKETDKQCWLWLNSLPGVHHVDVAFIHFEDKDAFEASPCGVGAARPIPAPTIGET